MKRRPGFTLIELLIVIVVLGLLAGIALSRFWQVKDRGYLTAMRSDLRNFAVQQERYFDKNFAYATDPAYVIDFATSPGVTIVVTWTVSNGWGATSTHASLPSDNCGYFNGDPPTPIALPATQSGRIDCTQ